MKIKTLADAARIVSACFCFCGRKRLAVPSGFTCEAHKLLVNPAATVQELENLSDLANQILRLPLAIPASGQRQKRRFYIQGQPGLFMVRNSGPILAARLGVDGISVESFVRIARPSAAGPAMKLSGIPSAKRKMKVNCGGATSLFEFLES